MFRRGKHLRRVMSDRGSAYLEYALLTATVLVIATAAFAPGSWINEGIGADYNFRMFLLKLPFF